PPMGELQKGEQRAHITSTDWHQDKGVMQASADNTTIVTAWCAISNATLDNGCLQVLTGAKELLPHCAQTQVGIAASRLDETKAVPLPIPAGGVIFFHPLTPHGSQTNRSDHMRWSFDLRYHVTGEESGRSIFPEFVARSQANPDNVLRDWRDWRMMWETARAHLANKESLGLYRWPSDGPYCA
ncbi:MAG: phytanoyl-CoA dioxygenase family protein, partial [Pseudomonadota bacterium]